MNEQLENMKEETGEKPLDVKSILMQYVIYWPWIAGCALVALVLCFVYLRYQPPVYEVNASVLIKDGNNNKNGVFGSGNGNSPLDMVSGLGMFSIANNFDNEVEVLHSRDLCRKVVVSQNLYIDYKEPRTFGYALDLYKSSPVQVWMTPEEADRLEGVMELEIDCAPEGGASVTATYTDPQTEEESSVAKDFPKLPGVLTTPVGTLTLNADSVRPEETTRIVVTVSSPTSVALSYAGRLVVEPTSKTTSIAQISLQDNSVARAKDFINQLVAIYNMDANDDKNEVATRTAEFIDERIQIINRELGSTEEELADYKQQAGLTNLQADAQLALQENSAYNQKRVENSTQIRLIEFLKSYINDPRNAWEVIPSNVGLSDAGLSSLIDKYNQILIERKRLLRTSSENNPAVVALDESIRAMRTNVRTTVESVEKGLNIARADLERQSSKYESRISNAPRQEKELISISRQQEIKSNLYLMLLQKREENAITLAAIANNGRMINTPMAGIAPVAPKSKMFYLAALLLGLAIPVGIIYLGNLLRFKIENRSDVEALTSLPIVGDIPLLDGVDENAIRVRENKNEQIDEIYRSIRTNILYMLRPGEKVVLFTSTTSGEGKSTNIGNVGASLAFTGKKVVVVGLDIRKPGLNKVFRQPSKESGITSYLSDPSIDLLSLCQPSGLSPNLYILPGGPVPPNPTELLSRSALEEGINLLKAHFDYVFIDSAPIAMVTDTQLIARHVDLSVYVCRADYTRKDDFVVVNEFARDKKLPNPCILINGVNMDKRINGYHYGYGKYGHYGHYGYGNTYGYGEK